MKWNRYSKTPGVRILQVFLVNSGSGSLRLTKTNRESFFLVFYCVFISKCFYKFVRLYMLCTQTYVFGLVNPENELFNTAQHTRNILKRYFTLSEIFWVDLVQNHFSFLFTFFYSSLIWKNVLNFRVWGIYSIKLDSSKASLSLQTFE